MTNLGLYSVSFGEDLILNYETWSISIHVARLNCEIIVYGSLSVIIILLYDFPRKWV